MLQQVMVLAWARLGRTHKKTLTLAALTWSFSLIITQKAEPAKHIRWIFRLV
jgi:hypothetical protein